MDRQRVILYGNSVVLAAIGASLERFPALELVSLAAPLPSATELRLLSPDVIFFDTGSAEANLNTLFALLQDCPDLLVVGARGRGGFSGLLLGSNALKALAASPVPVAVIHR